MADRIRCKNPAVLRGRISGVTAENKEPYNFCRDHLTTVQGIKAQYYGDLLVNAAPCECEAGTVSSDVVVHISGKTRRTR